MFQIRWVSILGYIYLTLRRGYTPRKNDIDGLSSSFVARRSTGSPGAYLKSTYWCAQADEVAVGITSPIEYLPNSPAHANGVKDIKVGILIGLPLLHIATKFNPTISSPGGLVGTHS